MILVTGAAGFIGYHTARQLLDRGKSVLGTDDLNDYCDPAIKTARLNLLKAFSSFTFVKLDISDRQKTDELFLNHQINKVCHLAAQTGAPYSLVDHDIFTKVNLGGFLNVIEGAKQAGVDNFVYASSCAVYSDLQTTMAAETDDTSCPPSIYGTTKRCNELIAHTYSRQLGLPATGLRFFTVYGPWVRTDMALARFARAIMAGQEVELYNFGEMERDFTYIDDIVDGIISAIDKNYQCEIFNLGNSHPVKLEILIEMLENLLGKKARKKYLPRQEGDPVRTCPDMDHAGRMLGYKPSVSIEAGLRSFVEWYRGYYGI